MCRGFYCGFLHRLPRVTSLVRIQNNKYHTKIIIVIYFEEKFGIRIDFSKIGA
jgi:hypothetical protein